MLAERENTRFLAQVLPYLQLHSIIDRAENIMIGDVFMFYFIRHGEPDYTNSGQLIFQGRGIHYAPLTLQGVNQIKETAKDKRLFKADIIISSPYTRSLQSAAILSRILQIELTVEPTIYEWSNDTSYKDISPDEGERRIKQYNELNGQFPEDVVLPWENNDMMNRRLFEALKKYKNLNHVIVVCHGMLIHSLFSDLWVNYGEIIEFSWRD